METGLEKFLSLCFLGRRSRAICALSFLTFGVSVDVLAQSEMPPSGFGIIAVDYRGTGCTRGTVTTSVAADAQAFTVMFSDYAIDTSARGGRPGRKVCILDLGLRVPPGWSLAVNGVQMRGYAAIQAGALGVAKALVSFGRMVHQEIGRQRLVGPFQDNFSLETNLPLDQAEWTLCRRGREPRLNIRTSITVRPRLRFLDTDGEVDNPAQGRGFPFGLLTVDAVDGSIAQLYRISWRRCGP